MTKQKLILKKIWQKPELRVLCRGKSEENVLTACKTYRDPMFGNGPLGWITCGHAFERFCNATANS
ncbi:MAG: hypothetical protein KAR45_21120 [Desulfobacteraceae bacterium]|nr:hypothetical protein [Desulfobacteraceae bacterium]